MRAAPLLLACAVAAAVVAPAAAPRKDPARLALETDVLAKRVELASGKEFYLLLDPSGPSLQLMLRAALLSDFPVRRLDVGAPRMLFVPRARPDVWQGEIWTGGRLDPERERERIEIIAKPAVAGQEQEEEPPSVPPAAEEIYEVPRRFLVRFQERVALDVRSEGSSAGWGAWFSDLFEALKPAGEELRVRVVLPAEAYASLYRSLPPDVKLLVLPPP